jgi:HlyD family secretion protein
MKRIIFFLPILFILNGCSGEDGERAMGFVERDRMILSAPISEQIRKINVEEGQLVKTGEVLIVLDDRHAQARVTQRKSALDKAKAKLEQLQHGARSEQLAAAQAAIRAAQAQLQEVEKRYRRLRTLLSQKSVSKSDVDSAKALREQSAALVTQATQQWLELSNGTRSEEIAQAQAQVEFEQAALVDAQQSLDDLSLCAPHDGIVDILPWKQGDRVALGTQLITLLATDRVYARVYLPETALGKINQGDAISVWIDGRDKPVVGTVHHIRTSPAFTPYYALNERDRARLMYLTEIDLPHEDRLPTGIGVEVHLP